MTWGRRNGCGRLLAAALGCAAAAMCCAPRTHAQTVNPLRLGEKPVSALPGSPASRPRIAVSKPWSGAAPQAAAASGTTRVTSPEGSPSDSAALAAWLQPGPPPASPQRLPQPDTVPAGPLLEEAADTPLEFQPAPQPDYAGEPHWPGEAPAEAYSQRPLLPGWFAHTDPNDPERHLGWGQPLEGTSWRNRPWYVGFFFGGVLADELVDARVHQSNGAFYGLRVGNDFDHYWGVEFRYAFARLNNTTPAGVQFDDSYDYWLDVSILHYPWGDTRLRPYLQAGLGFATYRFTDVNRVVHDSALTLPLGGGLKYFYSPTCSLRFDVTDNLSLGTGTLDTMHNVSFTAGVEFRFGGRRRSYYPWHGGSVLW